MRKIVVETIYWWVLGISVVAAVLYFIFGDIFEGLLDGFFHPMLLFGTFTMIAASGLLLDRFTGLSHFWGFFISVLIGVFSYIVLYYFLVIPLQQAESSSAHSIYDLEGRIGEVITSIPPDGYGEVFFESVSGSRNEAAKSFDQKPIPQGVKVVVVQIDESMYVTPFQEEEEL
ncbi:hypothetical protein G4V62_15665 [Bacillaceae bacterium SIJ1]|uniref:NfeD family protein n=1 Tax=Litoribacterium kuwaitense TaxID=1398745 RepID=UPI0013EA6687|nr:NfeD family protein [Litoribacterium kuwaitense]NGP46310.1 hypothetical protein [Litoribacterium kuwaitense]